MSTKGYQLPNDLLNRITEFTEEMLSPVQAVHGAKYAAVMQDMLAVVHAQFNACSIFCHHIDPLVRDLVANEMAHAFQALTTSVVKLLFEADLDNGAKMEQHYQTFTKQLMNISEATSRFEAGIKAEILGKKSS